MSQIERDPIAEWIGEFVEFVSVQALGQLWCARAHWCATRRRWSVWMGHTPGWARGSVGRGVALHIAIKELEEMLAENIEREQHLLPRGVIIERGEQE